MEGKSRQMLWVGTSAISVLVIAGVVLVLMGCKPPGGGTTAPGGATTAPGHAGQGESRITAWTPYASAAGKFKVMFCGAVKEGSHSSGGPGNTQTDYTTSADGPDGTNMGVTWTDLSTQAFDTSKPEEVVDSHLHAVMDFKKVISENKGMRHGVYAHTIEYQSSWDSLQHLEMTAMKGTYLYTVFGAGPKSDKVRKDLQTFLDSFDVTE